MFGYGRQLYVVVGDIGCLVYGDAEEIVNCVYLKCNCEDVLWPEFDVHWYIGM